MEQYPQFYNLSLNRYSCRSYSNAPVARDLIAAVLDAVRLAPAACNRQPGKFLVIDTPGLRAEIQKSYGRDWFKEAPVYIVALGIHDEAWHRPFDGKDHTDVDVAIAVEHLCLAATTLGLGTCWVCNFDPKIVAEALALPEGVEPVAIIPIGHPDTPADAGAPEKKRKEFDEIVKWGKF